MPTRLFLIRFLLPLLAVLLPSLSTAVQTLPAEKGAGSTPQSKWFTPTADKMMRSQALAELTKQTGIAVADMGGQADETIALDRKRVTFWQALDAIAAASKARVNLSPRSGRIVLDKRGANYRLPPISYDGRFRLIVKKVTTSRDLEIGDNDAHHGSTNLAIEIAWDPELLPLYLETRPRALRLVDDKNNVIAVPDEGSALAPVDGLIAVGIDLSLPSLPRSINTLRSLQGELSMIGPSKMLTFTFDRLDRLATVQADAPERRLSQEGVTCRILDVKLVRDRWTIRVALDYPPGMKQLDSNQSWVVNNEMTLETPDGKKRFASTNYFLESATTRQAILSYHFRDQGKMTRGKPSDWRVRYRAPANLVEVAIPFAFKDIALP
jgi:hypothetical protein